MTDEDHTAAKLKGFNCLIKFTDGEELFIIVEDLDVNDPGDWFSKAEDYLNNKEELFPHSGIALSRDTVKYIKQI